MSGQSAWWGGAHRMHGADERNRLAIVLGAVRTVVGLKAVLRLQFSGATLRQVVREATLALEVHHGLTVGDEALEQSILSGAEPHLLTRPPASSVRLLDDACAESLARGDQPGGTRLILEGTHQILTGSIGFDNALDASLGTYGWRANIELNSLFGLGEEAYGIVSSGLNPRTMFGYEAPVTVFGGGLLVPFDQGRISFNPEATFTRTFLPATPGSPASLGRLHRLTLRENTTLVRTRKQLASIGLTFEQIDETNRLPGFATTLSHDRYLVLRSGGAWSGNDPGHNAYGLTFQLSQGLGDSGGISRAQMVQSTIGYSRAGASNGFTHLNLGASLNQVFGGTFNLALTARGQSSFGQALFRAEQFALEGADGASAYVGGVTTVDEGLVTRAEISRQLALGNPSLALSAAPYAFVAGGTGRIVQPTGAEPDHITAASFGAGLRVSLGKAGQAVTLEYAHGVSDFRAIRTTDRANFAVRLAF
jgi:hemolysin activation/secretion protein